MEISLEAILREFRLESAEHLSALEQALVALESRPGDPELLAAAFRSAHTLKGAAACVGLDDVVESAHTLEDALDRLKTGQAALDASLGTLLLNAVDALRQAVSDSLDGAPVPASPALEALGRWLAGPTAPAQRAAPSPAEPLPPPAGSAPMPVARRDRTLRVDVDKLDRILNLMGELAVARGRIHNQLDTGAPLAEVRDSHRDLDRDFMELQELVMKARMEPLGVVFRPHVRTVRDLAVAKGRQVRLEVRGADVEVDTAVIEGLRDPLIHLVRNAVDHGVESPEARRAAGKDPVGTVRLEARHESGRVLVQVSDDGAGMDRARIGARAKEQGLCADPDKLPDEELLRLVLLPGFSTSDTVSDVSGRGVGLDVVRRAVEALHGSLDISSRPGRGTVFTLSLPLTLAIIDGFSVGVGDETYVLPLESVLECVELPDTGEERRACGVVDLRGEPVPFLRLADFFGLGAQAPARQAVVVVRHGEGRAGLAVDALHGEGQSVIKPLAGLFRGVPGISGSALLGNGRVALILDVPTLLREAVAAEARRQGDEAPASLVQGTGEQTERAALRA